MKNKSKLTIILKWGALLGAGLSLIKLLTFLGKSIDYEFGPVADLLMIVCMILLLYAGIKEMRDKQRDGLISFPKAFLTGLGISFVSGIICFGYFLIHYNCIEQDGIEQINRLNHERMSTIIGKDTVTTDEIRVYCTKVRKAVILQENQTETDTLELRSVDSSLRIIMDIFEKQLTERRPACRLDSFNYEAESMLYALTRNLTHNDKIAPKSIEIIGSAHDSIHAIDVFANRLEQEKDAIPHYENTTELSVAGTINALMYSILLNIFVALFLYRKVKPVCSAKEEEPAENVENTENVSDEAND